MPYCAGEARKNRGGGGLNIIFRGGGVHTSLWTPLEPLNPDHAPRYASYPLSWVDHLRFASAIGLSYESRHGRPTGMWVLRKSGKKWKPSKIDDDEYAGLLAFRDFLWGAAPEVHLGPFESAFAS